MIVEIENEKWELIRNESPSKPQNYGRRNALMTTMMATLAMSGMTGMSADRHPDPAYTVEQLERHYRDIRMKKSNLPRNERDRIVYLFEKSFKRVTE